MSSNRRVRSGSFGPAPRLPLPHRGGAAASRTAWHREGLASSRSLRFFRRRIMSGRPCCEAALGPVPSNLSAWRRVARGDRAIVRRGKGRFDMSPRRLPGGMVRHLPRGDCGGSIVCCQLTTSPSRKPYLITFITTESSRTRRRAIGGHSPGMGGVTPLSEDRPESTLTVTYVRQPRIGPSGTLIRGWRREGRQGRRTNSTLRMA